MHQTFVSYPFIFLGGGRKSFELPCISLALSITRIFFLSISNFRSSRTGAKF